MLATNAYCFVWLEHMFVGGIRLGEHYHEKELEIMFRGVRFLGPELNIREGLKLLEGRSRIIN